MRTWISWSTGKDSAWTLHVLRSRPAFASIEVAGLLTTFSAAHDRVAMHAVRRDLARAQARAAGVPLIEVDLPAPCSNADYEERMAAACARAEREGVMAVAFGDLFLADVRAYRERQLARTRLAPLFPLWGSDTRALACEMQDAGLRAIVTCVDPRLADGRLAGREFDRALLSELPPGADPCGENGEFHTFAFAGPMFAHPLDVRAGEVIERDGLVFADVLPAMGAAARAAP
jgi:uncharacterized protein (TIGR00290 family)